MDKRERFVTSVTCPECALNGSATWEENESGNLETTIKAYRMALGSVLITRLSAQTAALRHALSASRPVRSLAILRLLDDTCGTLLQFWNITCPVAKAKGPRQHVRFSAIGTIPKSRDVRYLVAIEGRADVSRLLWSPRLSQQRHSALSLPAGLARFRDVLHHPQPLR
jgi:hypothetical protein